jgi:hypothetical protein
MDQVSFTNAAAFHSIDECFDVFIEWLDTYPDRDVTAFTAWGDVPKLHSAVERYYRSTLNSLLRSFVQVCACFSSAEMLPKSGPLLAAPGRPSSSVRKHGLCSRIQEWHCFLRRNSTVLGLCVPAFCAYVRP